ncbi:GOLPH3/VPS74 family protein [Actinoplanes rectilineatus]|uniref:GOLPH3/VPS74 family protein n=1 Tax=Actinoplanes rectilineatus TaxID=113571 RepID=UPI0006975561|nr:GPP34 family phosphoprotein [Actinoplanes rectilineatus]
MIISLAEEIALIAYHDDGIARGTRGMLDYGIGGALVAELLLTERITVPEKKTVVSDASPTGSAVLDEALLLIAAKDGKRQPHEWIYTLGRKLRPRVLDSLVEAGILQRQQEKVLLVVPVTRYPTPDGAEPAAETDVRQRLIAAVTGDGPVDPRTASLCLLIKTLGWEKMVFADLGTPRKQVKSRLTEISEAAWAPEPVRRTFDDLYRYLVVAAAGGA